MVKEIVLYILCPLEKIWRTSWDMTLMWKSRHWWKKKTNHDTWWKHTTIDENIWQWMKTSDNGWIHMTMENMTMEKWKQMTRCWVPLQNGGTLRQFPAVPKTITPKLALTVGDTSFYRQVSRFTGTLMPSYRQVSKFTGTWMLLRLGLLASFIYETKVIKRSPVVFYLPCL